MLNGRLGIFHHSGCVQLTAIPADTGIMSPLILSAILGVIAVCLAGISIILSRAPAAPLELRVGQRRSSGDRRLVRKEICFPDEAVGRSAPRRLQPGRRVWDQRRMVLGEDITAALQREAH